MQRKHYNLHVTCKLLHIWNMTSCNNIDVYNNKFLFSFVRRPPPPPPPPTTQPGQENIIFISVYIRPNKVSSIYIIALHAPMKFPQFQYFILASTPPP